MKNQSLIPETRTKLALWCGVGILIAVGLAAVMSRAWLLVDPTAGDVLMSRILPASEVPFVQAFNQWFASNPILTLQHIIPGTLFLILTPLQFASGIRNRYIRFHRWSGRVIALCTLPLGLSGLMFGAVFPFGGLLATVAIFVASVVFLLAITRAIIAIRRGDIVRHREWMIRMFSIGLSISMIRIVGIALFPIIPLSSLDLRIGLAFSVAPVITFAVAEFWIRRTRPVKQSQHAINPPTVS